jgi:FG-GAP repeat
MTHVRWILVTAVAVLASAIGASPASAAPEPTFNERFTSYPLTVNGTYVPLVGDLDCFADSDSEFSIIWYAPGTAADSQWRSFDAGPSGLEYSSTSLSISGSYEPFVGDFDGNGCDDLAIGVPFEDDERNSLAVFVDVGAIHVLYGSPGSDLWLRGPQFWHQDSANADGAVGDARESGDVFGLSLAAGDLNADGYADLVVGVPFEDIPVFLAGSTPDAGAVNVFYGRANDGLSLAGTQFWHQDSQSVTDTAESGDQFSMSLAIGDFNGDSFADLAIGVPGEGITSNGAFRDHAGAVNVLHGSSASLTASDDAGTAGIDENDQLWHQNSADVADANETHDHFGGGRVVP